MSNGLDADKNRCSVSPDLGPYSVGPDLGTNYLQRLSADNKSCR